MCKIATVTNVAMKNQIATYKCFTLLTKIVANILKPNTTHKPAIRISIHHSNSAYSFPEVIPKGKVATAHTIINCHPQKLILLSLSLHILVFNKRCKE